MDRKNVVAAGCLAAFVLPSSVQAGDADPVVVENPFVETGSGPNVIDLSPAGLEAARAAEQDPSSGIEFDDLDEIQDLAPPLVPEQPASMPEGFSVVDGMIVPDAMLDGAEMVGPASLTGTEDDPYSNKEEACAYPEATPAGVYEGDDRPGGEVPRQGTIYLNFTGGVLQGGGENSAENQSTIARTGHMFPAYRGGEANAMAIAQAVKADFQFWQLRVVYEERPEKILPYTMVMIGGSYEDTTAPPSGGVAPLDCEDFGQRNVCYAFGDRSTPINHANVISQEVGHTMGLGHTEGEDRIMGAGYSGAYGDLIFGDECTATITAENQGAACTGVNKCHCNAGDEQDDRATLSYTYVPPGPDEVPPEIAITAPEDGAEFEAPATFEVAFDVGDNYGGYGWELIVKDANTDEMLATKVDYKRTTTFNLQNMPDGTYEIVGRIMDQATNETTDSITVVVGSGERDPGDDDGGTGDGDGPTGDDGSTGTGDGTTGGGDGSTGDGSTGGTGDGSTDDGSDGGGDGFTDTDADGTGASGAAGDESCACRSSAPLPGPAALLGGLMLVALGRRRRA